MVDLGRVVLPIEVAVGAQGQREELLPLVSASRLLLPAGDGTMNELIALLALVASMLATVALIVVVRALVVLLRRGRAR